LASLSAIVWFRDSFVDIVKIKGTSIEHILQNGFWVLVRKADPGLLLSFLSLDSAIDDDDDNDNDNDNYKNEEGQSVKK
jgi:hypothetical protein